MTGRLAARLPKSQTEWLKKVRQDTRDRQNARAEVIRRFALADAQGDALTCAHPVTHRRKIAYPDVAMAERAAQSLFDRFGGRRSSAYACPFGDHAHLTTARTS